MSIKQNIKRIASYIWDIPIERASSVQNEYLEVVWSNGIKMLNTKEANFSFGNGYNVFDEAMKYTAAAVNKANDILILGFGCGSILHILENKFKYTGSITGVEYDQEILRLFYSHFAPAYTLKPELHHIDALEFLENNEKTYPILFIDLFHELDNSPLLDSLRFRKALLSACAPHTTLVFNTTSKDQHGINTGTSLNLWLHQHFKTVHTHPFQLVNKIIIAY